jgi:hypothetical protein
MARRRQALERPCACAPSLCAESERRVAGPRCTSLFRPLILVRRIRAAGGRAVARVPVLRGCGCGRKRGPRSRRLGGGRTLAAGRREEQRKGAVALKDLGRSLSTIMGTAAPSPSGTGRRGKDRGGAQAGGGEGQRVAARRKGKGGRRLERGGGRRRTRGRAVARLRWLGAREGKE